MRYIARNIQTGDYVADLGSIRYGNDFGGSMLYLQPGEQITVEAIARGFDERSTVETGYLEGQLVFRVTVYGGLVGYIVPPTHGGVWGINLCQGAREERGYYRPILKELNSPFGVVVTEPCEISTETMIEDELVWDLVFFAPI